MSSVHDPSSLIPHFKIKSLTLFPSRIKEHYGYFTDMADRPVRMYLHEKMGMPAYKNYTRKEILMCAKRYHEKELADIEAELSGQTQNWQYDEE